MAVKLLSVIYSTEYTTKQQWLFEKHVRNVKIKVRAHSCSFFLCANVNQYWTLNGRIQCDVGVQTIYPTLPWGNQSKIPQVILSFLLRSL